jgi:hypothetical protein
MLFPVFVPAIKYRFTGGLVLCLAESFSVGLTDEPASFYRFLGLMSGE